MTIERRFELVEFLLLTRLAPRTEARRTRVRASAIRPKALQRGLTPG
jgi:hypothetical protein